MEREKEKRKRKKKKKIIALNFFFILVCFGVVKTTFNRETAQKWNNYNF